MIVKQFTAAKGLIRFDEKILLVRESGQYKDGVNVGEYDVPGGRIDPGEALLDGLNREIMEETGLVIRSPRKIFSNDVIVHKHNEEWHINRNYFACDATNDNVILSPDHDKFIWINPAEYAVHPIITNLNEVFKVYLESAS